MPHAEEDRFGLVGTLVAGRYAVEDVVTRGGSGLVYRATHAELAMPVALKVLRVPEHLVGAETALVERFRREARTLASLSHPAIVRVLDVGSTEPKPGAKPCVWLAMEWLDGVTLGEHVRARVEARLAPREIFALLAPAFDAITYAHERGIAHRDLKPANLMVVAGARGGVSVRVLDFGIAKAMLPDESSGTGLTETAGDQSSFSLPYAAPEQVGRLRTGPWTDVHALGLLVTELLTGKPPYPSEDSFALYGMVMSPERPTPARCGVSAGPWEQVLARAVALRPSDRFANATEFHAALEVSLDGAQRAWDSQGAAPRAPRVARRTAAIGLALPALTLALAGWSLTRAPARGPGAAEVPAPRVLAGPNVVAPARAPARAPAPETSTLLAALAPALAEPAPRDARTAPAGAATAAPPAAAASSEPARARPTQPAAPDAARGARRLGARERAAGEGHGRADPEHIVME